MLSDPLSVTYDANAVQMPRTSPKAGGTIRLISQSGYNTADGEFNVSIKRTEHGQGRLRTEIVFSRMAPDTDGPFVGGYPDVNNSFGVILESNALRVNTSVDLPKLRTALLAFLDTPMTNRLLGGEVQFQKVLYDFAKRALNCGAVLPWQCWGGRRSFVTTDQNLSRITNRESMEYIPEWDDIVIPQPIVNTSLSAATS